MTDATMEIIPKKGTLEAPATHPTALSTPSSIWSFMPDSCTFTAPEASA
eukprot:CAMPEP_0197444070 /NCGR_PEP_ID=MMETSP1175-20131217/9644_1 /TAXON_ID=1003142 /ORGANISM="Triceratium dubium, Strain CCMP147" /LENGTH=48 /DNA_ID= /DNA_START= /DNA_END= /DNA_ORIENTATION=